MVEVVDDPFKTDTLAHVLESPMRAYPMHEERRKRLPVGHLLPEEDNFKDINPEHLVIVNVSGFCTVQGTLHLIGG